MSSYYSSTDFEAKTEIAQSFTIALAGLFDCIDSFTDFPIDNLVFSNRLEQICSIIKRGRYRNEIYGEFYKTLQWFRLIHDEIFQQLLPSKPSPLCQRSIASKTMRQWKILGVKTTISSSKTSNLQLKSRCSMMQFNSKNRNKIDQF